MNRPAELQIAAEADGDIVKTSFQGTDRIQIGKSLRRMLMTAVSGIDYRNPGIKRRNLRGTFLWMTHCADICVAGNNTNGIGYCFAFGSG